MPENAKSPSPYFWIGRSVVIFLGIVLIGFVVLAGAINAYHTRHRGEHRQRLQRLLDGHPTEFQLGQILGNPLQAGATDDLVAHARRLWGDSEYTFPFDSSLRPPRALIYLVEDMVYLILLDASGTMVGFELRNN